MHQSGIRGESEEKIEDGLSRSTLIIAKKEENTYKFVDGILKYHDEDATLKTNLSPGNYLLYAKLDPTRKHNKMP